MRCILLDTGPLVAMLNGRDQYHSWTLEQLAYLAPPFLTCESVLSEAIFLLRKVTDACPTIMKLLGRGSLVLSFRLEDEVLPVAKLLDRYANVPMSLADACLVRLAELQPEGVIFTTDGDFRRYRKNGRHVIPTIMPHQV